MGHGGWKQTHSSSEGQFQDPSEEAVESGETSIAHLRNLQISVSNNNFDLFFACFIGGPTFSLFQVMYMYYFLGHNLWMDPMLPLRRKQVKAENTFLLALDGDIDFEPIAVTLLVDLMKRNDKVGAACGRIHPIGNGQ